MGLIVHKTVHASTMGPATASLAAAAVLQDTTATPVNTVCKPSHEIKKRKLGYKVTSSPVDVMKCRSFSNSPGHIED